MTQKPDSCYIRKEINLGKNKLNVNVPGESKKQFLVHFTVHVLSTRVDRFLEYFAQSNENMVR